MKEDQKREFLLYEFCEDEYEQNEMKKWIKEKGVALVYQIVRSLFYPSDD